MLNNTHDRRDTVSTNFQPYLRDLLLNFERSSENALTRSFFDLEKCSFFLKWVRILPEIDWYHYQGASSAPTCIVWDQTMTKTPMR